jgi:hypothetical protein
MFAPHCGSWKVKNKGPQQAGNAQRKLTHSLVSLNAIIGSDRVEIVNLQSSYSSCGFYAVSRTRRSFIQNGLGVGLGTPAFYTITVQFYVGNWHAGGFAMWNEC